MRTSSQAPGAPARHLCQNLAKAVNATRHPMDGDPCCQCPPAWASKTAVSGSLELDAASNNGVDQVRALRDEAIYAPANVKKRVYINEVTCSPPGLNALLKILESRRST